MNWKCLFGHQWDGCKCEKCTSIRYKEHKWNDCKCEKCGAIRNEGHKWVLLENKCIKTCSICGNEHNVEHTWDGCKCERCGNIRDEGHKWVLFYIDRTVIKYNRYSDERKVHYGNCIKRCSDCGKEHSIDVRLKADDILTIDNFYSNVERKKFLEDIIRNYDYDISLRKKAVNKIDDQKLLVDLVKDEKLLFILDEIRDQNIIADIADDFGKDFSHTFYWSLHEKNARLENEIYDILERITDQKILDELIEKNDEINWILKHKICRESGHDFGNIVEGEHGYHEHNNEGYWLSDYMVCKRCGYEKFI